MNFLLLIERGMVPPTGFVLFQRPCVMKCSANFSAIVWRSGLKKNLEKKNISQWGEEQIQKTIGSINQSIKSIKSINQSISRL